jgi:hypothetical protein
MVLFLTMGGRGAEVVVDTNQLPPAAQIKVDYERDIRPILEQNCLKCHGPERPRSHFRLDNRESALKGGEHGVDIKPGDSGNSHLIHYVALLVPDMEMPPEGKGEPLTSEQVGLLRAWIDQGASWGEVSAEGQLAFSTAMTLRWIGVHGDKEKFREIEGVQDGFGGGVESFSLEQQVTPDEKVTMEGRVLFPDKDILLKLAVDKADVGFVHTGFEQWRRYYDDTGGYYAAFPVPSFNLNQDLHLDIGRAWIDFGLTRPGIPQMVLGYEYQYKEGTKSMLDWGEVNGPGGKDIYPAAKDIHEHTHIIKFDLSHELSEWHVEDNARVEFYDSRTSQNTVKNSLTYTNKSASGPPTPGTVETSEGGSHVQGQNLLHVERQLTDGVFVSAGYLYSKFDGDASFDQQTVDAAGLPTDGLFWYADEIELKRETQSFSVSGLLRPWESLSLSVGAQPEWTRQDGFGRVHFDEGDPNALPNGFTQVTNILQSSLDTQLVTEEASLRFTRIPWTVLFAEGRWAQERIGQSEEQTGNEAAFQDLAFTRSTDFTNDRQNYRGGLTTSPWRTVSLTADIRNEVSDSDYPSQKSTSIANQYSAFILARRIDTDAGQVKLALRPANWLRVGLTYQRVMTDYHTTTESAVPQGVATVVSPGGEILAGKHYADVYGITAGFAPYRKWYLAAAFTYSDSKTVTAQNGDPSVVPYQGNVYSVVATANYALNKSTEFHAAYSFSRAAYGQDNLAYGLPLGLDFTRHDLMVGVTRRLTKTLTSSLRYAYYRYAEPTSGGVNDYTAQGIFATLMVGWP